MIAQQTNNYITQISMLNDAESIQQQHD